MYQYMASKEEESLSVLHGRRDTAYLECLSSVSYQNLASWDPAGSDTDPQQCLEFFNA